jgi:biopolymer transport protein ExbB
MKKLFALLTMVALLSFAPVNLTHAQADGDQPQVEQASNDSTATDTTKVADVPDQSLDAEDAELLKKQETFHQVLKRYFIEGDAGFMSTVLFSLIFGLALVIERVIYLNLATTNSKKLLVNLEEALKNGGVEAAKDICRNTRGPVASIFYQGLMKYEEGLDSVEKSIVAYGSVQMGRLEKGLSWISLFIALAPMLGFMGTVIGMIQAFDMIQAAGDISPTIVAGGIKVALLTTVFGLVVAIILQIFYNYLIAKVDSLVNDMEDSSISLIDILAANKK